MWRQPPSAVRRAKPAPISADVILKGDRSTRHSIWLGESQGKVVHIYRELAERESGGGSALRAPIYIAAGDVEKEVTIRLPKEIAMRLLMILSPTWTQDVARVL